MLDLEFSADRLRPATYNPRAITADALETLKRSITELGFCKPIIATRDGLLIAGHQRTRAATALGLTSLPVWVIDSCKGADEVRFNQLHNGTDLDEIDHPVTVPASPGLGFGDVASDDIQGNMRARGAPLRSEICQLLIAYGNWGCAVATQSGEVVSGPQYALACRVLGLPARVFRIPDAKRAFALECFGHRYGEFSYDHLPRKGYLQALAQPYRLREQITPGNKGGNSSPSVLYGIAGPHLSKSLRVLDFGCGQGDMLRHYRAQGFKIWGFEPFFRTGGDIDIAMVRVMADSVLAEVRRAGLFDVVICDSVINSVDSVQAEADVMTTVSAFCRPGGLVFYSGRSKTVSREKDTTHRTYRRAIEFFDANGFSALYRAGGWFYQKFHDREGATKLGTDYIGDEVTMKWGTTLWRAFARKTRTLSWSDVQPALAREFDLPLPKGKRIGRADEAVETLRPFYV